MRPVAKVPLVHGGEGRQGRVAGPPGARRGRVADEPGARRADEQRVVVGVRGDARERARRRDARRPRGVGRGRGGGDVGDVVALQGGRRGDVEPVDPAQLDLLFLLFLLVVL